MRGGSWFSLLGIVVSCDATSTAETSAAEDADASSAASVDCAQASYGDAAVMCRGAADATTCGEAGEAVNPCFGCVWTDWVPTMVDATGVCAYGEPVAHCAVERLEGVDGCPEVLAPCTGEDILHRASPDAGVEILVAPYCTPPVETWCELNEDGTVQAGPPECACACSDDFPGR